VTYINYAGIEYKQVSSNATTVVLKLKYHPLSTELVVTHKELEEFYTTD